MLKIRIFRGKNRTNPLFELKKTLDILEYRDFVLYIEAYPGGDDITLKKIRIYLAGNLGKNGPV